ncbi:MAG: hypothetical protein R6W76_00535 [Caldilinea sp.]
MKKPSCFSIASQTKPAMVAATDWKPIIADLQEKAKALRTSPQDSAVIGATFKLVQASLQVAALATEHEDDPYVVQNELKKVNRAPAQLGKVLARATW